MAQVKVSVIIPCQEDGAQLRETLELLASQELEEIEAICVDSGDGAAVASLLEEAGDGRFRRIQGEPGSCGRLLNLGLAEAAGEYVAFLRPGDRPEPWMYRDMALAADEGGLDIVLGDMEGETGRLSAHASLYGRDLDPLRETAWAYFTETLVNGIYRRSVLREREILFPEAEGAWIPRLAFQFRAFPAAGKLRLVDRACCAAGKAPAVPAAALLQACIDANDALRRDGSEGEAAGKLEGACARACIQRLRRALQDVPTGEKGMFLEQAGAFLEDLHNSGRIDYCGLEQEEHLWLARALHDRPGLLEDLLQGATPRMPMEFLFPYHLFPEGSRVAIYGAGNVGRLIYRQAVHDGYVRVTGIVDKAGEAMAAKDLPVQSAGALPGMDFDYVLIAIRGQSVADAVRRDLVDMGIPEEKIRWDGFAYFRDEFLRNLYFPLLRQTGCAPSHKDLLGDLSRRLRMAIYDHIFPYHLFQEGETIAIYGAGDVGRKFYQQAKDYGWVKCVVIVDKNAEKINIPGIPVAPIGALKQFKFDKVLISMTNEEWANEARETLIRMGIADERIKWAGKIYWREHFYRQYWFEYLRFIHEMRRSKI